MKSPRILITGLNGLIGWNLFRWINRFYDTFGTYRKFHPDFIFERCFHLNPDNDADLEKKLDVVRPDYVIHSWAMCDLDLCEEMPLMASNVNVRGTQVLLSAVSRSRTIQKFVYISTDHVFSGEKGGYTEEDIPEPKHVYGRTKLEAEKLVLKSGVPNLIVRPGLVIGESLQRKKGPKDFLFHRIRSRKPIHYFTDEWRSPILAEDLARQVLNLTLGPESGTIHVAGPRVCSRYELAFELAHSHGLSTDFIHPRLRVQDRWAHIRPRDISLKSVKNTDLKAAAKCG